MANLAVRVENLSKQYHIGVAADRHDTLRDQIAANLRTIFRLNGQSHPRTQTIWALKDISFEVKCGELVGIIGRNGSGKSTLLKILSRITEPTTGRAEIFGRVGSLLDVGTGFHPELTGRENIYLSASILGIRRRELQRRFDEIVAFAEIDKFLDTPVKRYSSGMYVRLAFAVAAHLEPEILIVDEVLAVGDAAFQAKCLGKMGEVAHEGRTVLFVSHNMASVTSLCKTGFWLHEGRIVGQGAIEPQVHAYLGIGAVDRASARIAPPPTPGDVMLCEVTVRNAQGETSPEVDFRLPFSIETTYSVRSAVTDLHVGVSLMNDYGVVALFTADKGYSASRVLETTPPGTYRARVQIPGHLLIPGRYYVGVAADLPNVRIPHQARNCLSFTIAGPGDIELQGEDWGVVYPVLPWQTDQIAEVPTRQD